MPHIPREHQKHDDLSKAALESLERTLRALALVRIPLLAPLGLCFGIVSTSEYLLLGAIAAVTVAWTLRRIWRKDLTQQRTSVWVVTCPETRKPAVVEIGRPDKLSPLAPCDDRLGLKDCSLWPWRVNCGRDCLKKVAQEQVSAARSR